ncbi:hypothetical protein Q31b_19460 [Novipirellula aureliae]|uniref:Uncharacterized protein n=1 Tax=Novipirellula aureliae TaxID=2527966 RepID=A0A5C6E6J1_9BACT|nr:hypothetical protein Q31b_19460 [Novipirellula aureliae]
MRRDLCGSTLVKKRDRASSSLQIQTRRYSQAACPLLAKFEISVTKRSNELYERFTYFLDADDWLF